ncbi:M48 family metalloprotease [Flavobacterium sp. F-328]|uniref:M48 family metalloprotease n=1 Tax=Flavobacterium erciyesense TaxID=2825842 RepID=A0ABS5D2Q2_9FLAO|nr:M48 family metalloprotease [Flavobacterium erciyesense]MBQ0908302.1 M48 family metalloprotease [Flavobacterium erciyesense]
MKNKLKTSLVLGTFMMCLSSQAQINLKEGALGALSKGVAGLTFSDADAAQLSKAAVTKLDAENTVAGPTDPYTVRLNRVFGKHTKSEGYTLNYKVYKLNEVNAFATADGSVRVYSGLMDIMDDNELLAVIGHEIGHVANSDTKDAIKASYKKEALIGLAASQSEKVAAITDSQLGKIGSSMIDSKHSRKQESEADEFSYNFMKSNGYNVNAVASAFSILAKMSEGSQASFLDKMMSSHPDPKERAENARLRAEKDGLFKPYVQQKPVVKKPVAKKPIAKKKK